MDSSMIMICLVIIFFITFFYYVFEYIPQKRMNEKKKKERQILTKKYKESETAIWKVFRKVSHIKWSSNMGKTTMSQLTSMRVYYDEEKDHLYLSINKDCAGRKIVYLKKGDGFLKLKEEDDDDICSLLDFIFVQDTLNADNHQLIEALHEAIRKYNDMERLMPELRKLPSITFGFKYD